MRNCCTQTHIINADFRIIIDNGKWLRPNPYDHLWFLHMDKEEWLGPYTYYYSWYLHIDNEEQLRSNCCHVNWWQTPLCLNLFLLKYICLIFHSSEHSIKQLAKPIQNAHIWKLNVVKYQWMKLIVFIFTIKNTLFIIKIDTFVFVFIK